MTENQIKVFNESIFEIKDGMINLTKMCQENGKDINRRKAIESNKLFIEALQAVNAQDVIAIKQGGNGNQGTFGTREIAIKVAGWISPKFEVFCTMKLRELFETGTTSIVVQPKLPTNFVEALEALIISEKAKATLELQAFENAPKVEFAEQLLSTSNGIDFGTASKAMGLGYGRNTLFQKCRNMKLINRNNVPMQKYVDAGYFVVLETSYMTPYGDRVLTTKTLLTAKGQQRLLGVLK